MRLSFSSCDSLVKGLSELVSTQGRAYITKSISGLPAGRLCKELLGVGCVLEKWDDRELVRERLGEKNYRFLQTELKEWLDPETDNPGVAWREDPERWAGFLREDGTFQYTYNQRLHLKPREPWGSRSFVGRSQIDNAKEALLRDPYTRQAFIGIWCPYLDSPSTLAHGPEGRVPCTLGYQFFIRERAQTPCLEMVYYMRSLNVSWNLWNDLFLVTGFFQWFLKELESSQVCRGVPAGDRVSLERYGPIYLQLGSLHSFED